jgi:hypothetical protein
MIKESDENMICTFKGYQRHTIGRLEGQEEDERKE